MMRSIWRIFPYLLITIAPVVALFAPESSPNTSPTSVAFLIITFGTYAIVVATFRKQWLDDLNEVKDQVSASYFAIRAEEQAAAEARYHRSLQGLGTHKVSSEPGKVFFRTDVIGGDVTHTFDPAIARELAGFLLAAADNAEDQKQESPTLWERLDQ
jgi:hypothetical protein